MLKKVSSTVEETNLNYVFRFSLPPLYPGGPERGRLRLSLPKDMVTDDCLFYFGKMPLIYPMRIWISGKRDVYVSSTEVGSCPKNSVWQVSVEISPFRTHDC